MASICAAEIGLLWQALKYTALYLGAVIRLPVIVFLNDNHWNRLHLLISGKPLMTLITFSSAADGISVIRRS